jgi:hypothetical protein
MSAQHTRRVFVWLNQIALDKKVPSSAFKVAYVIAQHINEETGEAWPPKLSAISADCIRRACGR